MPKTIFCKFLDGYRDSWWQMKYLLKFTVNVKAEGIIQATTPIHSHWWVGQYPLSTGHWAMRWYINKASNVFTDSAEVLPILFFSMTIYQSKL